MDANKQARWMLLEVPYAEDSTKMHAVLGYTDPVAAEIRCLAARDLQNIPAAIDALASAGADAGIAVDSSTVLVIPLDDRMMLASIVREQADARGWGFARHIPEGLYPPPADFPYITETGSEEDTLGPDYVRNLLSKLYEEGEADLQTPGEILASMGPFRHALRLGIHHFGWNNFSTVYALRDLAAACIATGADDNVRGCLFLVRILKLHLKPDEWGDDGEVFRMLLGQLADGCETMGDRAMALELKSICTT